jgi:NAD(P)-dependent dehydrogenase (short-subunit alcohol dehydrogenase family)
LSEVFMRILLTHARHYAGPGVLSVLLRQDADVLCHDASFADPSERAAFEAEYAGAIALSAQTPEALEGELGDAPLDGAVMNDVHPNHPLPIGQIPKQHFQASFDALFQFTEALTQALLPRLKGQGRGAIVFVTSARVLKPEAGFAVATSIRAATTAFAQALAREVAADGISVNVVAPNYLYSEAYYPRARFVDDPQGRADIAAKVPLGRLGEPQEIGELIALLVSGRAAFVTGQVIPFTGGWP